jgi:hypothetical protein
MRVLFWQYGHPGRVYTMNVAAGSGMPASVVLSDTSFPPHPTTALPNARMIAVVLSMSCPPLLKALNNTMK